MFDFFFPTHPFGGQTLRLVAQAQQGGGDIFDIARVCAKIETGNKDSWEKEWSALAQRIEAKGKEALKAGHRLTAVQNFFHANQYYRMADVFLTHEQEQKKTAYFLKAQETFRIAARLHKPEIEIISVHCRDEQYDGYFCHPHHPQGATWPAVLFLGGADAYAEEIYFAARPMLERGWAVLLVDTPGRGSSIYLKGITTRADYEIPGKACIDYLVSRSDVDPERIALVGISMAGYYAPRVAAFDRRIKALVGWSGCYSILDDLYLFCPHLQPTCRRLLGGVSDAEARELLKNFTMAGLAKNITCPTLISHGARDTLMRVEGARRLYEEVGSKDKRIRIYDDPATGGTIHCSHDNWTENVPFMLDWLEERL